jgi:hypothetical protein
VKISIVLVACRAGQEALPHTLVADKDQNKFALIEMLDKDP